MNLPNKITTFRMISVIVLVALLLFPYGYFNIKPVEFGNTGINVVYLIGGIIFIIASVSDFFDGYIARKRNLVTTYGKFMDPIADKLLVNSSLIILAIQGPSRIPAIVVVIMIARDIIVDAIRLIAIEKGQVIAASKWGKAKTAIQMVAITFVFFNDWPFSIFDGKVNIAIILCYVAGLVSLISGIDYLIKSRHLFKEGAK